MKPLKIILLILSIQFTIVSQAQVTTSLDATIRDVSEVNIGFNRPSDQGTWWTDNSFINLVSEMNPDVVRYPAGTEENYWDWSTGQFIPNTDKSLKLNRKELHNIVETNSKFKNLSKEHLNCPYF